MRSNFFTVYSDSVLFAHQARPTQQHATVSVSFPRSSMALSRECRALRESYEVFTSGVDPGSVIKKLYSKLLLTPEEKGRAMLSTLSAHQQLDVVFDCLERRVSADPSVFSQLVHVLLGEPALAAVGKKMQGESGGCCSCMPPYLTDL